MKITRRQMIFMGSLSGASFNIVDFEIMKGTDFRMHSLNLYNVKLSCGEGLLSHTETTIISSSILYFIVIKVEFKPIRIFLMLSGYYFLGLMGVVRCRQTLQAFIIVVVTQRGGLMRI